MAAVHAERGFLMLYDAQQRLTFRSARGLEQQTIEAPEFQVSRSVVERVAQNNIPLLTSNAQSDAWLGGRASIIGLGLRSILCVPLQLKQTILGVIYVDNHLQAGIFSRDDLDLLVSIAASAAIAIENARLYQVAVEKGRLERELQMAREVQRSLLPQQTPALPGFEIAAWWLPAREVSGDYYDYLKTDPDRLVVVIADVSDKGMPAALLMALTRSTVRACLTGAPSLAAGITNANRLLAADAANGMFVTLFCAEIGSDGEVAYVNAGHNPPLLVSADGITELRRCGPALGLFEDAACSWGRAISSFSTPLASPTPWIQPAPNLARNDCWPSSTRNARPRPRRWPPAWPPRYKRSPPPRPPRMTSPWSSCAARWLVDAQTGPATGGDYVGNQSQRPLPPHVRAGTGRHGHCLSRLRYVT